MTAGALLLASVLGAGVLQVAVEPGGLTVRVPVRGAPGVPEVRAGQGEIVVEVPEGKLDRASTALVAGDGGTRRLPVEEVSASTSRSRHRGLLALRLRDGASLPAERVSAQISQGVLTVRVAGEPTAAAGAVAGAAGADRNLANSKEAGAAALGTAPAAATGAGATDAGAATRGTVESPRGALVPARSPTDLALRALPFLAGLALVAWLLVRQRGRLRRAGRPGEIRPSAINIVATRVLGRSQRLMVVDVDKRRFLLSASEPGGVSLLSPIEPGATLPAAAGATAARGKDGLDDVFADMLKDLSAEKPASAPASASTRAPAGDGRPAAASASAANGRAAARPVLQLVDDEPEAAGPRPAPPPPPSPPRRPVTAEIPAREAGPGSADVAGLLALRQSRHSGALKGIAR